MIKTKANGSILEWLGKLFVFFLLIKKHVVQPFSTPFERTTSKSKSNARDILTSKLFYQNIFLQKNIIYIIDR